MAFHHRNIFFISWPQRPVLQKVIQTKTDHWKSCGPTRLKWESLAAICKGMFGEEKCYACGRISRASGLCGSHWHREERMKKTKSIWNSREDGFYNLIMILNLKSLMEYLKRCKLKVLPWPSQSPDLTGSDLAKWPNNPTELEDFWMEEGTNIPQTRTGAHLAG